MGDINTLLVVAFMLLALLVVITMLGSYARYRELTEQVNRAAARLRAQHERAMALRDRLASPATSESETFVDAHLDTMVHLSNAQLPLLHDVHRDLAEATAYYRESRTEWSTRTLLNPWRWFLLAVSARLDDQHPLLVDAHADLMELSSPTHPRTTSP